MEEYEAVVIGGGPGGYVAGIRLGQLGVKTLLVERDRLGGECLNRGCIPSKVLIRGVDIYWEASKTPWIKKESLRVDWSVLQEYRERVTRRLSEGVGYLLRGYGVKVVEGEARLRPGMTVEIRGRDGSETRVRAENIVIAVGGEHIDLPAIPRDGGRILGSTQILEIGEIPGRLLIVGGGVSGLEIGTFFAKLGTRITIVEVMDQLLPGIEKDLVAPVQRTLKQLGAEIHVKSKVTSSRVEDGVVRARVETPGGEIEVEADYALVAVGKRGPPETLGHKDIGVETDERGFIKVDEYMSTNVEGVYAVGDATGPPFLAHRASAQGIVAAENIAGRESIMEEDAVPSAIFTDPEIAFVGLTRSEAERRGFKVRVGRFGFQALGRAIAEEKAQGFVRVVASEDDGRVLGVQMVGPHVSELIGEATIAVRNSLTVEQFAKSLRPHPTFSEAVMEAAEAALWKPIHMLVK